MKKTAQMIMMKNRGRKEHIVWISRNQIRKEREPQKRGNMWIRIDLTERKNGVIKSYIYIYMYIYMYVCIYIRERGGEGDASDEMD